jgi:hypothetical protein
MSLKNILSIIILCLAIGLFVYMYYDPYAKSTVTSSSGTIRINKSLPKKVTFDDVVTYYTYETDVSENKLSDIDFGSYQMTNSPTPQLDYHLSDEDDNYAYDPRGCDVGVDAGMSDDFVPKGRSNIDAEQTWDASFGFPLMSKNEKNKFFAEMQKNHKKYEKSIDQFSKQKSDRSGVIKSTTTIDPFKPDYRSNSLKGRQIKDIYDEQVQGPRAVPKKIKYQTSRCTMYEDESTLNGGTVKGSANLHPYNGISGSHKTAAFGNEF